MGQVEVFYLSGPGGVVAGHERGGGAKHYARLFHFSPHQRQVAGVVTKAFRLLVRSFVLLVDNDNAYPFQRCKDGGAGADDDGHLTSPDPPPLIVALAVGEPAVQNGNAATEAAFEASYQLRRKGDFRHQNQGCFSFSEDGVDGPQIDFRFAAAGDAVQEKRGE